jgi:predicted DNA-binding protein (MmcQ/YjbR family)
MITIDLFRELALSLPDTTEEPHFEKTSFRVRKKIYATYDDKLKRACVKLSRVDQSVFCAIGNTIIYPVPNSWGRQGWTFIDLEKVAEDVFMDALTTAYCDVAPANLAKKVNPFRRGLV